MAAKVPVMHAVELVWPGVWPKGWREITIRRFSCAVCNA